MQDIPVFTSQFGLASLLLREIPRRGCAYVVVHSAQEGHMADLLDECRRFCRMAGAETVLATADAPLERPCAYELLELACHRRRLPPPAPPVALEPMHPRDAARYAAVYDAIFRQVPGAAVYTLAELERVLEREQAYLALVDGQPAGLGQYSGAELRAIGVLPPHRGLGRRLALTLLAEMPGELVTLEVSSANAPALRLYHSLGFAPVRVVSRWYALTGE